METVYFIGFFLFLLLLLFQSAFGSISYSNPSWEKKNKKDLNLTKYIKSAIKKELGKKTLMNFISQIKESQRRGGHSYCLCCYYFLVCVAVVVVVVNEDVDEDDDDDDDDVLVSFEKLDKNFKLKKNTQVSLTFVIIRFLYYKNQYSGSNQGTESIPFITNSKTTYTYLPQRPT